MNQMKRYSELNDINTRDQNVNQSNQNRNDEKNKKNKKNDIIDQKNKTYIDDLSYCVMTSF